MVNTDHYPHLAAWFCGIFCMACIPDKSASTDATNGSDTSGQHAPQDDTDDAPSPGEDSATSDTGSPCPAPQFGVVSGQVNEMVDMGLLEPQSGAKVLGQQSGQTIQGHAGENGYYTLTLPTGTWILEAQNPQGTCFSSETPTLEVTSCSTLTQDLVMDVWDVP